MNTPHNYQEEAGGDVKPAMLALADGTVFKGDALGFEGETVGEVVFKYCDDRVSRNFDGPFL